QHFEDASARLVRNRPKDIGRSHSHRIRRKYPTRQCLKGRVMSPRLERTPQIVERSTEYGSTLSQPRAVVGRGRLGELHAPATLIFAASAS
ncbi:MAG TPA: hypothetical protein VJU59_12805, partial [Paraburkholderia sp.]|uniref:hypothetical protein n=1 Tax=Paraburkholderia sp. TaxID=1926495 RepID=UPI002B4A476E